MSDDDRHMLRRQRALLGEERQRARLYGGAHESPTLAQPAARNGSLAAWGGFA